MRARNAALVSGAGVYRSDEALMCTSAGARIETRTSTTGCAGRWSPPVRGRGLKPGVAFAHLDVVGRPPCGGAD